MYYVLMDILEILLQYNSFNLILMYHFDSLDATTQIVPMPTTETTPGNNAQRQKMFQY